MTEKVIRLGDMMISEKKWAHNTYDSDDEDEEPIPQLDPSEIVVKSKSISITYEYPLRRPATFTHTTNNPSGFTRKELSELIMQQYHQIYYEDSIDEGKYEIYGHSIDHLVLVSLYFSDGAWIAGVDS